LCFLLLLLLGGGLLLLGLLGGLGLEDVLDDLLLLDEEGADDPRHAQTSASCPQDSRMKKITPRTIRYHEDKKSAKKGQKRWELDSDHREEYLSFTQP